MDLEDDIENKQYRKGRTKRFLNTDDRSEVIRLCIPKTGIKMAVIRTQGSFFRRQFNLDFTSLLSVREKWVIVWSRPPRDESVTLTCQQLAAEVQFQLTKVSKPFFLLQMAGNKACAFIWPHNMYFTGVVTTFATSYQSLYSMVYLPSLHTCTNRTATCNLYCGAVQDAIELIQKEDENFSPEFDPYADLSTLSDMSQLSAATPGRGSNMPLLNDSSIFSPNTCSKKSHQKAICASSEESFEMHSTPVKSDFCPEMGTPPTDILCKVERSRKNGGRKRAIKNGTEQVDSEPKKLKTSDNGRSTSTRRSGKKKKKTNGVSEIRHGASGDDCEEEVVTKRLNFDTDLSARSDILQPSLHPPTPVSRAEFTTSAVETHPLTPVSRAEVTTFTTETTSGTVMGEDKEEGSESGSEAPSGSEPSESESDDLPAINMEVNESVSGGFLGMLINICSRWVELWSVPRP